MIFSRFKWDKKTVLELNHPVKAYIYFRSTRLNLLTGFPESVGIDSFIKNLDGINLQDRVSLPRVYHFYYTFGLYQAGFEVSEDAPLAIELEYRHSKKSAPKKSKLTHLPLKTLERPSWSEYKEAFEKIQENLRAGNCYQVNLTYPYDFQTDELLDPRDIADYFFSLPELSAYAHATYFGEEMFVSNSPECLFQYANNEIITMPIKGTAKRLKDWKKVWAKMQNDVKEESELLMITDLLKNDLNRLEQPRAKVKKLRAPLLVTGLVHQYSLISLKLSQKSSLGKTISTLFPGGSITGAPKKRVMDLIDDIERWPRGIYCGSTLLCYKDKKVACINIRTATLNVSERMWRYGAGGGVTLLSKNTDEFKEMESKVESFLTLVKAPGYSP